MNAPLPPDETGRLAALRRYEVLDTPPEEAFDDLTRLAAHICQTPIALICLIDETRQWFKSKVGLAATETPRNTSICAHAILHGDAGLQLSDTERDPRFAANPLVTGDPHVRSYAGIPLLSPEGPALGVLSVCDHVPRTLTPEQFAALRALSRNVVAQLELRRQTRELAREAAERRRTESTLREQFQELSASKAETDRLLALAHQSRRALLSVVEDEKRAGQSLRQSEERFRDLAENINEVFWMTDPAMRQMIYVSPAYEKIWGRTCASLYASPRERIEAIHPEDRDRILQAAAEVLISGKFDVEYRIIRPDQSIGWIHDRGFPVRNDAGKIYRIAGTAEDITLRKKLEDQFRHAQKMEGIGQLAGGVAHDFNNMLTAIQMQAHLLKISGGLTSAQTEFADEIIQTVERASALTRQLLLFSRREVFQPRDLDLNESITSTIKMLRRILGENIQMQLKFSSQPLFIHADAGMIDQVLLNLVVNARDAMPNGGQVIIETAGVELDEAAVSGSARARPGSFIRLSVNDNGTGIPPEILPRIFDPFFTTKDVGKGTGLGLATVFGIVEQHQGWIDVESRVGHGTSFRICLPRLVKPTDTAAAAAPTTARTGHETILLAEDDPTLRASLRQVLNRFGYAILEAPTGEKALKVWREHRDQVRLLLTDLVMPDGMSGIELARRIRQEDRALPVIYMSGYSPELMAHDGALHEGVNFFTKPFSIQKLAEAIRHTLDAPPGASQPAGGKPAT